MDLIKGKQIFFECYGNHLFITKEYSKEYDKCNVPKEYENIWKKEIKDIALKKIACEKGPKLLFFADRYIDLVDSKEACDFIVQLLHKKSVDTFTILILLEKMKNIISKNPEILDSKYSFVIEKTKEYLIKQNISIDEDYYLSIDKNLLSKAKIKERINKL